ncbi:MAG TPA: (d)CMP kinase [Bacillota bacterium]|nr:(d)CMP kinase [Bacillota bacterium]
MSIAIDGPAGAGKSTVAQLTAKRLGFTYIDTGAMYRALTLAALTHGIPLDDERRVGELLNQITIDLRQDPNGQRVVLNNQDITREIRDPEISRNVSIVAKHPAVREKMTILQRRLAVAQNVVMDGRDIGTHVLPQAEVKIFLTASIEERAIRRYKELIEKGHQPVLEELKEEILLRDRLDSEREVAPLRPAEDAIIVDTTGMSIENVVEKIGQIYSHTNQTR